MLPAPACASVQGSKYALPAGAVPSHTNLQEKLQQRLQVCPVMLQ